MNDAASIGAYDPRLLQQMIDAGLVDSKDAGLQDQLAAARALRGTAMPQGRMVGNVFVKSSPFEMASAALQQGLGAYREGKIGRERSALQDQRRAGREAAAGLFGQPGAPIDTAGLLGADDAAFAEQQRAIAEQLRGEQARASAAAASGDPVISGMARDALGDARRREEQLSGLATTRLQRALEKAKAAQAQANQDREYGLNRDALTQKGSQFDRELALKRDQLASEASRKKASDDAAMAEDKLKTATNLRKEFQGLEAYKNAQTIAEAYKKIVGTSESGPGDVSLIYSYMRMVDPGSTVREGEFATAAQAGAVPDRVVGLYNRLLQGEKLPPEVRKQFREEAKKLFAAQASRYAETASPYRRLAQQAGVSPDDVVLDLGFDAMLAPPPTAPGAAPAPAATAADLRKKYGL